jgi:hypothetical protein
MLSHRMVWKHADIRTRVFLIRGWRREPHGRAEDAGITLTIFHGGTWHSFAAFRACQRSQPHSAAVKALDETGQIPPALAAIDSLCSGIMGN